MESGQTDGAWGVGGVGSVGDGERGGWRESCGLATWSSGLLRALGVLAASLALGLGGRSMGAPAQPLDAELAVIERSLSGADVDAATRGELMAKADGLRVRLLEQLPEDDRASAWCIDRAVFTLAQLSADGTDHSALLGLPTPAQRTRVLEVAGRAMKLLDQARDAANRSTPRIEEQLLSRSGSQGEIEARATAAEAKLRRLQDVELAQRIPYFRALCRVLMAGVQEQPSQRDESAKVAIGELRALVTPSVAGDAARRTLLGAALLRQVIVDKAAMEQAKDLFSWVVARAQVGGGGDRTESVDPLTLIRARMGLRVVGGEVPEAPGGGGGSDWRVALAEAEGVARRQMFLAQAEPARQAERMTAGMTALLQAAKAPTPTAEETTALRLLAYAKASALGEAGLPAGALPPEALFGRGVTLARGTGDEAARGAEILNEVAGRADAPAELRADALWERAVILTRASEGVGGGKDQSRAAFDTLTRLVREHPASARSVEGATTAANLYQTSATATVPPPAEWADQLPAFRLVLEFLLEKAPTDRWRLAMVTILLDDLEARATAKGLERARGLAEALTGAESKTIGKQLIAAAMPRAVAAARAAVNQARTGGDPVALTRAQSERTAVTAIVAAWAGSNDPEWGRSLGLEQAEALADQNDPGAPGAFERLIGTSIDQPGTPEALRIRLGLARAQRAAGENASAFATYRELAEQYERQPGVKEREPAYWAAWSGMLEILTVSNTDGTRSAEIDRQMRRLELIDTALGGAPFAERFERVREGLKRLAATNPPPALTTASNATGAAATNEMILPQVVMPVKE